MKFCSYCGTFVTSADICSKCGNSMFLKIKYFYSIIK